MGNISASAFRDEQERVMDPTFDPARRGGQIECAMYSIPVHGTVSIRGEQRGTHPRKQCFEND